MVSGALVADGLPKGGLLNGGWVEAESRAVESAGEPLPAWASEFPPDTAHPSSRMAVPRKITRRNTRAITKWSPRIEQVGSSSAESRSPRTAGHPGAEGLTSSPCAL